MNSTCNECGLDCAAWEEYWMAALRMEQYDAPPKADDTAELNFASTKDISTLTCRICLDDDARDHLIAPCECSGTCKYVHRKCLDKWRASGHDRFSASFSKCPTCKFAYQIRAPKLKRNQTGKRRIKCVALVTRDILLTIVAIGILTVILGALVSYLDDYMASCMPECQESTAGKENSDGFIGPTCTPCSPFRHALFDPETPRMIVYSTFGASLVLSVLGFGAIMANGSILTAPRGVRVFEPILPKFGNRDSGEAIVLSAAVLLSIIGFFVALFFSLKGIFYLAKKHAQYVGLYVAAEDYFVVDLERPQEQTPLQDETVEDDEVENVVRHALMQ